MISQLLLVASALLAQLATVAIMSIHIVSAQHLAHVATVGSLSILSAAVEIVALILLICLSTTYMLATMRRLLGKRRTLVFAMAVFMCLLAAAASVATLIYLSQAVNDSTADLGSMDERSVLVGASLALALSVAFQLIFLITHFLSFRGSGLSGGNPEMAEDGQYSPNLYVKGLRYSQTLALETRPRANSFESRYAPSSTGSMASTVSQFIRPMSSKTRLLSTREKRRGPSLDSEAYRSSTECASDPWDASSSETITLQTVISPPVAQGRFLETIPASPTVSGDSTPDLLQELELPQSIRRSRSYSPVGRRRDAPEVTNSSSSELHIHPLFRTDSPTPPPIATPGTVVLASPIAGQVIAHRQSVKSLRRIRSGSLASASSPLSRQGSFEGCRSTSSLRKQVDEQSSMEEVEELSEEEQEAEQKVTKANDSTDVSQTTSESGSEDLVGAGAKSSLSEDSPRMP